jgi:isoquinoline 1-oxidoreductase subunit beta
MASIKTSIGRRSFLKTTALTGGGMMLGFSWLASCQSKTKAEIMAMPKEWFDINSYLKIGDNGIVTILTPNPEFGQNVRTSMPMLIAEELDIDWKNVLVEQAPYHAENYGFQFTGGSRGIMSRWEPLRMAGASARHMLRWKELPPKQENCIIKQAVKLPDMVKWPPPQLPYQYLKK